MALAPFREAVDAVALAGGEALKQCYQCGLCTGTCPWNLVKSFPTRKLIHQAQLGLVDFESEDTWTCATCRACVARCPRGVAIIDIMRALRNIVAEMGAGHLPDSLRVTLKNIAGTGNPLGEPAERRTDWINDGEITHLQRRCRGALLLLLRARVRSQRPQGGPGHRQGAPEGGGQVRHHRRQGELLRGERAQVRQRDPLPEAGPQQHRRLYRERHQQDSGHLAALPLHLQERVPETGRQLRGRPLHRVHGCSSSRKAG